MPALNLETNVSLEGIDTSALIAELSKALASTLGKPSEKFVQIVLKGSIPMLFGGTEEPTAYGELISLGGLNPEMNKALSEAVGTILETKLSIPKTRYYIKFYTPKGSDVGYNGTTF